MCISAYERGLEIQMNYAYRDAFSSFSDMTSEQGHEFKGISEFCARCKLAEPCPLVATIPPFVSEATRLVKLTQMLALRDENTALSVDSCILVSPLVTVLRSKSLPSFVELQCLYDAPLTE